MWELQQRGIDATLICDSAAAQVMREGRIDAVITGADRIAANGDTANKIGTYSVATLAQAYGIPFYVAAPARRSTLSIATGDDIPIEQRAAEEITNGFRHADGANDVARLQSRLRRHARRTDPGDHHRPRCNPASGRSKCERYSVAVGSYPLEGAIAMQILAQQNNGNPFALYLIIRFMVVAVVWYIVFWIWMLVDCIRNEPAGSSERITWIMIMLVIGPIGAMAYSLNRRKQRIREFGR